MLPVLYFSLLPCSKQPVVSHNGQDPKNIKNGKARRRGKYKNEMVRDEETQGEQTVLFDAGRGCAQGPIELTM